MSVELDALVASPWWEWMPGMLDTDGGRLLTLTRDGEPATWHVSSCDGLVDEDDLPNGDGERRKPDIDDPATQGCLLALVRKAWGPGCRFEIMAYEDGSAFVSVYGDDWVRRCHEVSTNGQALAAALLAAPAPTAGEP